MRNRTQEQYLKISVFVITLVMIVLRFLLNEKGRVSPDSIRFMRQTHVFPEIDTVMKLGMAHPMGPLQLADFIGLDVCLAILNVMYDGFKNPKYAPNPLLVNMVMAGKMGVKSGEGFYDYSESKKAEKVAKMFAKN